MEWTFGTFLWSTLVVFFWVMVFWMFITVFADIIRRDMSGWAKAGWILLIVLLPFLGILIYLIAMPRTAYPSAHPMGPAGRYDGPDYRAADEIAKAARLHEQGAISADEFERLKRQALRV